ncbi:unnamed protein product [Rodentolepis nana]|uniref:Uncharacterized protein n=1 Tax=Rodentolepis nana TaxID=102285 RepID=A0A0R3TPQ9_RODNA|nr:unnamed protein product [Rodentolepis nana]
MGASEYQHTNTTRYIWSCSSKQAGAKNKLYGNTFSQVSQITSRLFGSPRISPAFLLLLPPPPPPPPPPNTYQPVRQKNKMLMCRPPTKKGTFLHFPLDDGYI